MRIVSIGWRLEHPDIELAEWFTADSLASYDAVLVDPASVPALWRGQAALEGDGRWRLYPGRDLGLSEALERLFRLRRDELGDLIQKGGGVLVVRVRAATEAVEIAGSPPVRITPYTFLPQLSLVSDPHHLALPQGLRFIHRRGRDLSIVARFHPFSGYLAEFADHGYEAVMAAALGAPLQAFGRVLSSNKVGDIVAWDLPVDTGRIVFLPAFPGAEPRRAAGLLVTAIAELLDRPLPDRAPEWLNRYLLPGEAELSRRLEEIREAQRQLAAEEEHLVDQAEELSRLRGLLYPRGRYGLRRAVQAALGGLGFSVEEWGGDFLIARDGREGLLVKEALSEERPVGPAPYRELLVALDELRNEAGLDVHGLLVAVAGPRLDPRRRGRQWTEAVGRGCKEHGIALASGTDLFEAVGAVLGGADPELVRRSLLTSDGPWRWKA
jgi:hypothetical protein